MSTIEQLLHLQEFDTRIREIEQELKDIPERKRIEEARLDTLKQNVEESEKTTQSAQAHIKELELEVDSNKEKINKLRTQQLDIKTNKEFKAIESEISMLESTIRNIEDKQLLAMDSVESARIDQARHKSALDEEQGRLNEDLAVWDEREKELQQTLTETRTQRSEAAQHVDNSEFLSRYEFIHSRKNQALVALQDGFCGGCHMSLPPYVGHELRKQINPVCCSNCGCMLYLG